MICPKCGERKVPDQSLFCNMCGCNLQVEMERYHQEQERKKQAGEIPLLETEFFVGEQKKKIAVYCKDITAIHEQIDLLTISVYPYNYIPTRRSVIGALFRNLGISVEHLALNPLLDLRKNAGCWISKEVDIPNCNIQRIGGIEIPVSKVNDYRVYEEGMIQAFKSYLHLLDIATQQDISIKTIAMPILGAGDLGLDYHMMVIPFMNEVLAFMQRNPSVEKLLFIEYSYEKALLLADSLIQSERYMAYPKKQMNTAENSREIYAFISYTENGDRFAADQIASCLKKKGVNYWYASKDIVEGDYASAIVDGIQKCTHFICLISQNSMSSPHVLNELNLAFSRISEGVILVPFLLDREPLVPSFRYYLSRMQWYYGIPEPRVERIEECLNKIFKI